MYILFYGDINDVSGHANTLNELNKTKELYNELIDELKEYSVDIYEESYLNTSIIYPGENLKDSENYSYIYYDIPIILYEDKKVDRLSDISKNYEENRHYDGLFYDEFNPLNETYYDSGVNGGLCRLPILIGVNNNLPSDVKMEDLKLVEGRFFTDEELQNGAKVILLNENDYIFTRDGVKRVNIGDKIPLSIHFDEDEYTEYYEVIGILRGTESSISLPSRYYIDIHDIYSSIDIPLQSNFYIPLKTFNNLNDKLNRLLEDNNISLSRESNGLYDDVFYYAQHIGYRPLYIGVNKIEHLEPLIDITAKYASLLNDNGNLRIKYGFVSNLDNYLPIISSVLSNSKIFIVVSLIAIISSFVICFCIVLNDIESSKKDFGIFISLGVTTKELVIHKTKEYFIILILPTVISILVSFYFSKKYILYLNNKLVNFHNYFTDSNSILNYSSFEPSLLFLIILFVMIFIFLLIILYLQMKKIKIKQIIVSGDQ